MLEIRTHGHSGTRKDKAQTRLQLPRALRMPMHTDKSRLRNKRRIRPTYSRMHQRNFSGFRGCSNKQQMP